MGSFLDGFADGFTNSYNVALSRKSDKERTALGYETLEEQRRAALEEERLSGERLEVDRGQLDVQRGQLDIQKSAEERAQEEAPSIKAEREANTRRLVAEAADKEFLNSPEGRKLFKDRQDSDIALQNAQTDAQRQAIKIGIQEEILAKYHNTDQYQAIVEEQMQAEAAANRGTAAANQAQAGKTKAETSVMIMGQQPEIQRLVRTLNKTGMYPFEVTVDHVLYMNEHDSHMPPNPETYKYTPPGEEGAIPEGEVPAEEPAAEPEADPDLHDEPAPGENPDEPYMGDGPLRNAPIPAPVSGAPLTRDRAATDTTVPGDAFTQTFQRQEQAQDAAKKAASTSETPPGVERGRGAYTITDPQALVDWYQAKSVNEIASLPEETKTAYKRALQIVEMGSDSEARVPTARPEPPAPAGAIPTAGDVEARAPTPSGITQASYTPGEGGGGQVIEAQSGTRKLPLNDKTRSMMEQAAAQTGLTVKVTSGAQESSGPNRTGSHRHDSDVGAGDIQLIDEATGKPVSMNTPEGREKMLQFMRAARDAGATGFGAGLDYMGDTTIHVGFGDPGVWGAGGKGANAPKWLKDGMNVGAGPSSQPQGTGSRPKGVAQAYQILQQNDMPQMQAAVLAGNIQQESGGDPNAFNQKEGAKGIIQWRQDRLDKLNQFAADNGGDANSLETQIQFLIQEGESLGSGQDKAAWQAFMSATTPEEANAALKGFIRYGDESAGTRLEYANNLLASGGAEITGERGQAIPVQGEGGEARPRLPTPRGEVKRNIIRSNIVKGGREAGIVGAKAAVQQAGLTSPPPAVPTTERQAAQKAYVTGDPKAGKTVAKIREVAQKTLPPGTKVSDAEMNLYMLNLSYQHALEHGTKEQAQAIMGEMHQAFRAMNNQYVAFAQSLAANGRTDEAVKTFIKSQTYISDGMEATASKDADGNFIISIRDMETDEIVEQVVRTPTEVTADILGWNSSANLDRQMLRAAGKSVPSLASEAGREQLAAPIEPPENVVTAGRPGDVFARQAIPVATPINTAGVDPQEQFTDEEQGRYNTGLAERNKQIDIANKAAQPPAAVDRDKIRAELAALAETAEASLASEKDAEGNPIPGSVGHSYQLLKDTYGNNLNSILTNVLQTNPGEIAEQVAVDIARALSASNPEGGVDRLPMQASRGDYEGTWKLNFIGSPTTYNVPSETAMAIRNGLVDKMQTEQEKFGKEVFGLGRDKPKIAAEAAAAAEATETQAKQERYTPQALGRKAGVRQGAIPLGPPIRHMPGYKPVSKPYSEGTPQRRF